MKYSEIDVEALRTEQEVILSESSRGHVGFDYAEPEVVLALLDEIDRLRALPPDCHDHAGNCCLEWCTACQDAESARR